LLALGLSQDPVGTVAVRRALWWGARVAWKA
jgi:hypothetical protein